MDPRETPAFDRCNLRELSLDPVCAHGGEGLISFRRIAGRDALAGECNFIDVAVLPPGASIGRHTHGDDEEEFYLVLDGDGTMWRDGRQFPVRANDLVRTGPGGSHELVNTGTAELRIFVFEVRSRR